jgi:hypothetical protein
MEIFIARDAASVQLFFNIFTPGIETFVIPWDKLLYTCVVVVCHLGLEPLCDNFQNNRCSVTISCNKEREICGK